MDSSIDKKNNENSGDNSSQGKLGISIFSKIFSYLKFGSKFGLTEKYDKGKKQVELDKKLVFSLSKSRVPSLQQFKYLKKYLSKKEIWALRISWLIILLSLCYSAANYYYAHLQVVPIQGGEYVEGLIGAPKYINPLYSSVNDVDNDISHLVYSSLFKRDQNGLLINDLAESYEISEDNKVYSITIKQGVQWHDGRSLTADDIVFTFNSIKDNQYKSPLRISFQGVSIDKIDDYKIKFVLPEPYAAFLELLTFGVLPAELWYQIPPEAAGLAELNLKPVGSGPYRFKEFVKDKSGNILNYKLEINDNYYEKIPFVNIEFKFFSDYTEAISALNEDSIDGISYLPRRYREEILTPKSLNFHQLYLPQLTALFFNQKNNVALKDKLIRQALAYGLDREYIVQNILGGEAKIINGPILPNSFAYDEEIKKYDYNPEEARKLIEEAGWELVEITNDDLDRSRGDLVKEDEKAKENAITILKLGEGKWYKKDNNYLLINLSTVERNENAEIINAIKEFWEKIGIKTSVEVYSPTVIQSEVIKPRNFEVLFYGQVVGADPDPYAFWHSSQVGENGFNIANYVNKDLDQLLEDARVITDKDIRREKYIKFQKILAEELPAMFLYSPLYVYVQNKKVKNFNVYNILYPYDRFSNITDWYIKTGKKLIWDK